MSSDFNLTRTMLKNFLDVVTTSDGSPLSLIVPNGRSSPACQLVATAARQLEGQEYDLAVVVSEAQVSQIQLQTRGRLSTTLGDLEIDREVAEAVLLQCPDLHPVKLGLKRTADVIEEQFCVLAAFIKQMIPNSRVLPVVVPPGAVNESAEIGSALTALLRDRRTVLIAQADLDQTLLTALEFNDLEIFRQAAILESKKPLEEPQQALISAASAAAALSFSTAKGGNTVSVLQKSVQGKLHQAAVMLWDYQPPQLSPSQQTTLLNLAAQAIDNYVSGDPIPDMPKDDPDLMRKAGVFVTLRIQGILRGCIGHLGADKPLAQAVQEMAVAAATSDPRFPPLSRQEFEKLHIKVAVLSPLRRITYQQVQVGVHGLLISHGWRRGVLLPEVAVDRGWDRDTFLDNLCFKAGLPADTWRQNPNLFAFTSLVIETD